MFYLEVVGCIGEEVVCSEQLYDSYDALKDALDTTQWIRFVVTELTPAK
jgi:hypothetical protein